MKALEIAEKTRDAILSGKYDQVEKYAFGRIDVLNFLLMCKVSRLLKYFYRFASTYLMEIWWGILVILRLLLWLVRLPMMLLRCEPSFMSYFY